MKSEKYTQIKGILLNHPGIKDALDMGGCYRDLDNLTFEIECKNDVPEIIFKFNKSSEEGKRIVSISSKNGELILDKCSFFEELPVEKLEDGREACLSSEIEYVSERLISHFDKNGIEQERKCELYSLHKGTPVLRTTEEYQKRGLREVFYQKKEGTIGEIVKRVCTQIEIFPEHNAFCQKLDCDINLPNDANYYCQPLDFSLIENFNNGWLSEEQSEGLKNYLIALFMLAF